jgi:hypothetical protein
VPQQTKQLPTRGNRGNRGNIRERCE